jgi:O-antigen/teichoic acid export membrane protein
MSDKVIDIIGLVLWFSMFFTPLFTFPFIARDRSLNKRDRLFIGLLLALALSAILFFISRAILLRNGIELAQNI